ncbi:MAG: 2-oxo acid dehydrogenase subunit E2 [Bacilli bacterium]
MKKKFGDRKDAYKIKIDGFHKLMIQIKPKRCDSDVYINKKIDVTDLLTFLEKKNKENPDNKYTLFHAFIAASGKTFYNRPYMNRFICNGNYYQRKDITISFIAKTSFEDDATEYMATLIMKEDYNIDDIQSLTSTKVKALRSEVKGEAEKAVDLLGSLPKILRYPIVGALKFLDRRGWLPQSLADSILYYSSLIITNLGSIHCGAIYHNIVNFGTNSMIAAIGEVHKEIVIGKDGKESIRDICEVGINIDERIADGFYFVQAVNLVQYIIENPILLEDKLSEKVIKK